MRRPGIAVARDKTCSFFDPGFESIHDRFEIPQEIVLPQLEVRPLRGDHIRQVPLQFVERSRNPVGDHHTHTDQNQEIDPCKDPEGEIEIALLISDELEKDVPFWNPNIQRFLAEPPEEYEYGGVKAEGGESKDPCKIRDQLQLELGFNEVVF
jgi:hypothetical protein